MDFLVLKEFVPLALQGLDLLLHRINFFLVFVQVLGVARLHLLDDALVGSDRGLHLVLEVSELLFVPIRFCLLELLLLNLLIEVMLYEFKL